MERSPTAGRTYLAVWNGYFAELGERQEEVLDMDVLVINQDEVRRLLPMNECIDLMAEALRTLSLGNAVQPLRTATWLPDRSGLLGLMPGYLGQPQAVGVKVVTVFPRNHGTGYDSHQGAVMLFDIEHGQPLAIFDAGEITAIRTAAVSAVATNMLAREDSRCLALLGSGIQAKTHLEALQLVRKLQEVRVWSRTSDHATEFAQRESTRYDLQVNAVESPRDAVDGADVICTVTGAREPVLRGEWIAPGAHINAVGACTPNARELDTAAVLHSRLFVDRKESALHESGDFLLPKAEGVLDDDHIVGELGDVLLERVIGRSSSQEITLFKSLGLAVEDLAAAHYIFDHAKTHNLGTTIRLGGRRDETA